MNKYLFRLSILTLLSILFFFLSASVSNAQTVPTMVKIKGGVFTMGKTCATNPKIDVSDELPAHKVKVSSFKMSETEITNKQFEEFCPEHRTLRGKNNGISSLDDEAVVYVTYYDAVAYCKWLSEKTHRNFRLPTEAEWEYACRAGSTSTYCFGDTLPSSVLKNQATIRDFKKISLEVKQSPANAFGLYDMHGNVEEWCSDWYAPYIGDTSFVQVNPRGPQNGDVKVTRGGSHGTPVVFLRTSCRLSMIPEDCHSQTGFRIVESNIKVPSEITYPVIEEKCIASDELYKWKVIDTAYFSEPKDYVIDPIYSHNHQPAVCYCPNGDILATWYSTGEENGRRMVELSSRLHPDTDEWTKSELFFKVPGRNITGLAVFNDNGVIRHLNGVEASGDWQNLIMIQRLSYDNGYTWTHPLIIEKEHAKRHQVIQGTFKTSTGALVQLCDAGPAGDDGTSFHMSLDGGKTWNDMWDSIPVLEFRNGEKGTTIAGIHAGAVELKDGSFLALGRGNTIDGKMPMSISTDGGRTWNYSPSEFPPISSGQRLILLRLQEGPILMVAFTDHPDNTPKDKRGMMIGGKMCYGLYAAVSFDEGKTWPVKKLISDGKDREMNGGAWTNSFKMDATHAEPKGYMAAVQSPDGLIHLLSSKIHYSFNLKWLMAK